MRYAARDLPPLEAAAFETRLAGDQSAREALAEAVRLSAAALGQESLAPDRGFRALIRERIRGCTPGWLARRVYRGHPLAWAGAGAGLVAAATLLALQLASPASAPRESERAHALAATVPPPVQSVSAEANAARNEDGAASKPVAAEAHDGAARTAAEIWAELSTPGHVEKTHDDEARLHHRLKNLHISHRE